MKYSKEISHIYRVTSFFFAIGILMSLKLWMGMRVFPQIPVFENIVLFNTSVDTILIVGLISTLILNAFILSVHIHRLIFAVLLLVLSQDQMRWQPWVYHYILFLLPFCFKLKRLSIFYFQFILITMYFWAGVNKINVNFVNSIVPLFISDDVIDIIPLKKALGYLIPAFEICISYTLLFHPKLKIGIKLAILMHLVLIVWLVFSDISNSVIIPWNIAMILFLVLCFYKSEVELPDSMLNWCKKNISSTILMILFFLLPLLNFWGKWDNYLSFSLYSGKSKKYLIGGENLYNEDFAHPIQTYPLPSHCSILGEIIDIDKWSLEELNVPVPSEKRIYKSILKEFCKSTSLENQIFLLEQTNPYTGCAFECYTCQELEE